MVSRLSSLDTYPYYYSVMASFNAKRTSRKRIFAEEGKLSYVLSSFVFSHCRVISFSQLDKKLKVRSCSVFCVIIKFNLHCEFLGFFKLDNNLYVFRLFCLNHKDRN